MQKRLGKEAHASGGRLRRSDGVVENARPRTEPPSLPNSNLKKMDDVEDDAGSQSGSSEGIPASLRCDSSGSTYTAPGSPLNRSLDGSPLLNDDHDGVDPGNPGIAAQGVTQELAGLEPVELEIVG